MNTTFMSKCSGAPPCIETCHTADNPKPENVYAHLLSLGPFKLGSEAERLVSVFLLTAALRPGLRKQLKLALLLLLRLLGKKCTSNDIFAHPQKTHLSVF